MFPNVVKAFLAVSSRSFLRSGLVGFSAKEGFCNLVPYCGGFALDHEKCSAEASLPTLIPIENKPYHESGTDKTGNYYKKCCHFSGGHSSRALHSS